MPCNPPVVFFNTACPDPFGRFDVRPFPTRRQGTMASADFCALGFSLALARTAGSAQLAQISPGKNTSFQSIPAASTLLGLLPAGVGTLCCLTLPTDPLMQFLFVRPLPAFEVPLTSDPQSPTAPLRLANWLRQLASRGLAPPSLQAPIQIHMVYLLRKTDVPILGTHNV